MNLFDRDPGCFHPNSYYFSGWALDPRRNKGRPTSYTCLVVDEVRVLVLSQQVPGSYVHFSANDGTVNLRRPHPEVHMTYVEVRDDIVGVTF